MDMRDIAKQARRVLAASQPAPPTRATGSRRYAAKQFSAAEQAALISEGNGHARARNLDRLDITGTHYEAIEDDDQILW